MDRGDLVPDEVIIGMILDCVNGGGCADGFLLDGFPRTVEQAEALDDALAKLDRTLTAVLLIEAPDEEIVTRHLRPPRLPEEPEPHLPRRLRPARSTRASATRTAPSSSSATTTSPRRSRSGSTSTTRRPSPLIPFYEERELLRRFDGTRSPTEVHDHIRATIATLRLEDQL